MPIDIGDAVKLASASGPEDPAGRVCRIYPSGMCCVQFDDLCVRLLPDSLVETTGPAPECTAECTGGC